MRRGSPGRCRSGSRLAFSRANELAQRKRPRAQRLSSSWAHGGWKLKEINLAQSSFKSKLNSPPLVVTVAVNFEVSPKPYLVGMRFLAFLMAC